MQTFWLWAGAKVGNEASVMESIAAIYRPSALFLTNKENFVADNGDFSGTVINSSNMLWSLSGNISLVHKVLMGIRFTREGLVFKPFVPTALKGNRTLSNFKYRNAILDIEVDGFGDAIESITLDGARLDGATISPQLTGKHVVKISMNNHFAYPGKVNKLPNEVTLATPNVQSEAKPGLQFKLAWPVVEGAVSYGLFRDGKWLRDIKENSLLVDQGQFGSYQLRANGPNGMASFLSEPMHYADTAGLLRLEAESFGPKANYPFKGFSGTGFIEVSTAENKVVAFEVNAPRAGTYSLSFIYSNGNGPVNTENKCALRSLYVADAFKGAIVFPQRGTNEWSAWGKSNILPVQLKAGLQKIVLKMEDWNENMNGETNQAMLDALLLQYVGE